MSRSKWFAVSVFSCAMGCTTLPEEYLRQPASAVDFGAGMTFSVDAHPYSQDPVQTESFTEISYETNDSRVRLAHAKKAHTDLGLINSIDQAIVKAEGSETRFTVKKVSGDAVKYKLHTLVEGKKVFWFDVTSSQVECTESQSGSQWTQDCAADMSHAETKKRLKHLRKITRCEETATGARCSVSIHIRSTTQTIMTVTKTAMIQAVSGALRAVRSTAMLRAGMLREAGVTAVKTVDAYKEYDKSAFEECMARFSSEGFSQPNLKSRTAKCP